MYVEEIDWSKRIVSRGWQAYCVPAAVITHFGGQSTGQIRRASFINLWTSRYQFYRRYYGLIKFWLARQIVQAGMKRQTNLDRLATARGELTQLELSERVSSYKQVIDIWQEKSV